MIKKSTLYIVDKKVYDLKDWIPIHPGGAQWFFRSNGRDITSLVYTYHKDSELCKKILAKYETDIPYEKALDPYLNAPRFLLPEDFNVHKDSLNFDFTRKDDLLSKVKQKLATKEWKAKV